MGDIRACELGNLNLNLQKISNFLNNHFFIPFSLVKSKPERTSSEVVYESNPLLSLPPLTEKLFWDRRQLKRKSSVSNRVNQFTLALLWAADFLSPHQNGFSTFHYFPKKHTHVQENKKKRTLHILWKVILPFTWAVYAVKELWLLAFLFFSVVSFK